MTARNADGRASSSPLVILSGATATGKTDLVLEIARRLPVDIISADAAQVYRRMDIGTAKPDPETLHRFPHRLIDIRDPHESYSAAEFRRDAIAEIEASLERGRIPLVTGGTMFYLSALVNGLSELPSADEKTRSEILDWADREGWDALHAALTRIDPPLAKRIDRADRQRLQRAHEIHRVTGRPPSEAMRQSGREALPHRPIGIAVFRPSRESLHLRIARRFSIMLEQGFIDEVSGLRRDARLHADAVAMRTVGYRQCWEYLDGQIDLDTFREKAVAATRQLAKRQLTWLRGTPGLVWMDASHPCAPSCLLRFLDSAIESRQFSQNRVTNQ